MAWTRTGWGNFNPRPPRGGRPRPAAVWKAWRAFQSTPSARRATQLPPLVVGVAGYFNPRPPRGGRPTPFLLHSNQIQFQSTPSARRATPDRGKTEVDHGISIHALREEGDCRRFSSLVRSSNFNPRPPRGGRQYWVFEGRTDRKFQSTPSARRATALHPVRAGRLYHFNPRPPRGGRRKSSSRMKRRSQFQSTPSARRATDRHRQQTTCKAISIHALREEGDQY